MDNPEEPEEVAPELVLEPEPDTAPELEGVVEAVEAIEEDQDPAPAPDPQAEALAKIKSVTWIGGGEATQLYGEWFVAGVATEVSPELLAQITGDAALIWGFEFNTDEEEDY